MAPFKFLGRALLTMALLGTLVTPVWAQDQVKIGAIMSLTGYLAVLDNAIADGAQLAVERINTSGGLLGKKLVLIVEDTKSQPSPAVTAFRKLTTQDQVQFFVNGCSTAASRAVEPAQAKAKMPSVVCTTLPAVDQVGHPWVFTTLPNARFEIGERFTYLRDRGLKRVGMLQDTTPYGAIGRQVAEARAKEFDITIVGIEQYRPEDTDITPQLTKLKAGGIQGGDATRVRGLDRNHRQRDGRSRHANPLRAGSVGQRRGDLQGGRRGVQQDCLPVISASHLRGPP